MKSSRMKKILAVILCLTLGLSTNMMTMAESVNSPAVESVQEDPAGSGKEQTVENVALQTTSVENTETEAPTPEATPAPTETAVPEVTAEPTEVPVEEATPVPTETPTPEVTAEPTEAPVEETTPVPTEEATPEETEEPTEGVEIQENQSAEEQKIDLNSMTVEEIYAYLSQIGSDGEYISEWNTLSEEKLNDLVEYITQKSISGEITVDNSNGAVNFAEAAPLVMGANGVTNMAATFAARLVQRSSAFNVSDMEEVEGVELSKELINYNAETGIGELQLEAFVTGKVEVEQKSIPTDIILVLDQSGSMANTFGTGERYNVLSNYENQTAYDYAKENTIYAKTAEEYVEVKVERHELEKQYIEHSNVEYSELYRGKNKPYYYYEELDAQYYKLDIEQKGNWITGYTYTISYIKNGQKQPLVNGESNNNANFPVYTYEEAYEYKYSYTNTDGKLITAQSTGATGQPPFTLYLRKSGQLTALDSLANAVENFVGSVQENAKETGADHRIAIAGFASDASTYFNTEILTGVDIIPGEKLEYQNNNWKRQYSLSGYVQKGIQYKSNGYSSACENALQNSISGSASIQNAINALTAYGGTQTDHGVQMAYDIFDAQTENIKQQYEDGQRNKVVVVFTDGEPTGNGSSWSNSVANDAVEAAKKLKNSNTTVYSVGIFDDANGRVVDWYGQPTPEANDRTNMFMHLLSSNYPNAQSYSDSWQHGSIADLKPIENPTESTGDYSSYFLSANDSEGLNNVFQSISEEIGGADISLNSTTVLNDVLSDYFELPEGTKKEDIKVYTENCTSVEENQYTFDSSPKEYTGAHVEIVGKTINVSGFDYSANYVGLRNGQAGGKKLIVQIPIQLDNDATFGGNNIPTNQPTSGLYDETGVTCYGNFAKPVVNVPVDYQFTVKDQTIHLTTAADLTQIPDYANGYTPNGINNKFVTIEYTLSDSSGDKVGTFSIPAGVTAENGTWTWENGKKANPSGLTECTDYSLTCTVNPIADPTQTKFGIVAKETKLDPQKATVHVLIPGISCSDTTVFIHDVVLLAERYDSDSISWVDKNKDHTNSNVITTEPSVTVTPEYVSGTPLPAAGDYRPEEDSDFNLKVMAGGINITENCHIIPQKVEHTADCIRTDGIEAEHDFTIHVVAGSIQINKKLLGKVNTKLEGNPVFTFRIVYQGQDGSTQTFYRTIEFEDDDKDSGSAEILKGLPRGTYTVTELTTQKFKFNKLEIEDSTTCKATKEYNSVKFEIGESIDGSKEPLGKTAAVTFTNEKDGPSTNTDTDVVVNRFVFDEASNSWTVQQIWNPGEDQTITNPKAGQTSSSGDNQ